MNACMAHRGWSGKAPENTLAAIRMAAEEPGIDAIEIDVQLSKDGVPVVIHDFTLERTTDGSGFVGDHTYEELSALDAGSWFSPSFAGERIPSLEEVLQTVKGKRKLNIELKRPGNEYEGMEAKVIDLINNHGMESEVMITSFHHETIRTIKGMETRIPTGLIIYGKPTLIKEQLQETGATILSMAYPYLTPSFISGMIDEGITMLAWTIDHPDHIKRAMELHPQLNIVTNHPDRMFALRT
ncbi:glycerophosphodiester phosphodiesterase [Brevibacillus migulae]|uniref:glycerophosphodiester phosphodiesterase n=1 Tax=Brevibacillus migulae TaxID=1644114 RepID=UPI00106E0BBC|nr:glycerophosphodiester phosphodiesterase family protein [Brevibacillus migulae]